MNLRRIVRILGFARVERRIVGSRMGSSGGFMGSLMDHMSRAADSFHTVPMARAVRQDRTVHMARRVRQAALWEPHLRLRRRPLSLRLLPKALIAQLVLNVPADAIVYLSNQRMTLEGTVREFTIPGLQSGTEYAYPVRVRKG